MMPRKFTDSELDEALALRAKGEKWIVVEAMLGDGIKNACDYRRTHRPAAGFCNCNQGRLPCSCKPDAWVVKVEDKRIPALTEQDANDLLCKMPGATKHALFERKQ
jgi:hypothetical protein